MISTEQPKRFLAYRKSFNGTDQFVGTVEGTTLQVIQELKKRWKMAYRDNRIDLIEVARA